MRKALIYHSATFRYTTKVPKGVLGNYFDATYEKSPIQGRLLDVANAVKPILLDEVKVDDSGDVTPNLELPSNLADPHGVLAEKEAHQFLLDLCNGSSDKTGVKLTPRERELVRLRFIGNDEHPEGLTLKMIGKEIGISPEGARQTEARLLKKLRGQSLAAAELGLPFDETPEEPR